MISAVIFTTLIFIFPAQSLRRVSIGFHGDSPPEDLDNSRGYEYPENDKQHDGNAPHSFSSLKSEFLDNQATMRPRTESSSDGGFNFVVFQSQSEATENKGREFVQLLDTPRPLRSRVSTRRIERTQISMSIDGTTIPLFSSTQPSTSDVRILRRRIPSSPTSTKMSEDSPLENNPHGKVSKKRKRKSKRKRKKNGTKKNQKHLQITKEEKPQPVAAEKITGGEKPSAFVQTDAESPQPEVHHMGLRRLKLKQRGKLHASKLHGADKMHSRAMAQREEIITLPPIIDEDTNQAYSPEELAEKCENTRNMGETFGITDISRFAEENCPLIKMYYSDVTCKQIIKFVDYCKENKMFV